MITPGQCRAARAWLRLHQQQLAELAGVSLTMVKDFESEDRKSTRNNVAALKRALEDHGIQFADNSVQFRTRVGDENS